MKIAVPSEDDSGSTAMISEHFGRSPYFTIIDTEGGPPELVSNISPHHGPSSAGGQDAREHRHDGSGHHGHGDAFISLSEKEVDVLVCRGLGMRALRLFNEKGIKVFCGAKGSVGDAVDAYLKGSLTEAGPDHACSHGHHH